MEIKNLDKIPVIKFTTKATLKDLDKYTGVMPTKLMEKANELGIDKGESQIWQYTGSDGNPDTVFTLDICIPITEAKGSTGEFQFDVLPAMKCVSEIHEGAWKEMGKTYQKVIAEMLGKSMKFTGVSREIYIKCDFENQQNSITEVQVAFL